MKIALITDTHFGCRQDNISLLNHQTKFLRDQFFPFLEKEGIDTIIHLGDLVDRRRSINYNTAKVLREEFIEPWKDKKIIIIPGNHDSYHRNTIEVNALQELLTGYDNVEMVLTPTVYQFGNGYDILTVPWICDGNREDVFRALTNTQAEVVMGHLELNGFEMHKGVFCDHGLDRNIFKKFSLVCSGHFHHKSTYQNINYLGSPWQMTWADYGDTKGFHILDTVLHDLTFIENTDKLFHKIKYNDTVPREELFDIDFSAYANSYVKIIVQERTNPYWFDQFVSSIEESDAIDVQVVEDHLNLNLESADDIINQAESTLEILSKSIKSIDVRLDVEVKLDNLLRSLYNEANIIRA